MRIRGSLLAVAVLLMSACARDVAGAPVAGDLPARHSSPASAEESEGVAECEDCDSAAISDATENPVVAHAKRVGGKPVCENIVPLAAITGMVGADAHPGGSTQPMECNAVWETQDLSRVGQLWVDFSGPPINGPADVISYEGNTRIEHETSAATCVHAVAVDDALKRYEDGSWLVVKVNTENGVPEPCGLASQLLEIAFGNLADVQRTTRVRAGFVAVSRGTGSR